MFGMFAGTCWIQRQGILSGSCGEFSVAANTDLDCLCRVRQTTWSSTLHVADWWIAPVTGWRSHFFCRVCQTNWILIGTSYTLSSFQHLPNHTLSKKNHIVATMMSNEPKPSHLTPPTSLERGKSFCWVSSLLCHLPNIYQLMHKSLLLFLNTFLKHLLTVSILMQQGNCLHRWDETAFQPQAVKTLRTSQESRQLKREGS
jgi:hypothetical protein